MFFVDVAHALVSFKRSCLSAEVASVVALQKIFSTISVIVNHHLRPSPVAVRVSNALVFADVVVATVFANAVAVQIAVAIALLVRMKTSGVDAADKFFVQGLRKAAKKNKVNETTIIGWFNVGRIVDYKACSGDTHNTAVFSHNDIKPVRSQSSEVS